MKKIYLLSILTIFSLNLYCQTEWTKRPSPVMLPGSAGDWDKEYIGMGCVIYYGDNYHMWYSGGTSFDIMDTLCIGYATSPDGITWTKDTNNPVLDPGSAGSWDENQVMLPSVIVIDDTLHMWYTGHRGTGIYDYQIGHATSPDGITWTKDPNNPVLPAGPSGAWDHSAVFENNVVYDGTKYHMWYLGCNSLQSFNKMGHATSPDGLTWTKDPSNPVLYMGSSGSWDYPRVDFASVVFDGTIFHMWYSGGDWFQWEIGYATTTDGSTWTKYPSNPVINRGQAGSWDSRSIANWSVIDSSGVKYKMWYLGNKEENTASIGYAEAPKFINSVNLQFENIISVYPNPANEIINIQIDNTGSEGAVIELLTSSGQVIYRKDYKNIHDHFTEQIDLSSYTKGLYFVRIRQSGAVYNGKIIVQ